MKISELTFEEFLEAKTAWNDALRRSLDNHIFLTWEWLSIWWKHYGHKRRFLLITVRDGGKILAAAPLMSSRYRLYGLELRKVEFIATPASDYHGFLLTERKPEYVKMMLEYAARIATKWDCIELQEIPDDSETARILRGISEQPLKFEERIVNRCPYVFLPRKFEDYLQRLGYGFRKNLRRYERKLKRDYKVDFRICNTFEAINKAMKRFFDLHQKRWRSQKQPGAFLDRRFRDFHLEVAKSFAENGWLTLNFLLVNDKRVAAGYDFTYARKLFYYLSGFDPEYSRYNVGHLRHMYLMKHCIERGVEEYDFMRGDEPYKMKWNTAIRRNLEVRTIKRKIIPIAYNWITKSNRFSPLTLKLGKHLSIA